MMPGISCSAISISLRPYTCAEILRTQKSELPWLFVCDVFSRGEALTQILSQHKIQPSNSKLEINFQCYLIFVTAWSSVRAWTEAILGGGRGATTPKFIKKISWKFFFLFALIFLLTCTSSSLLQPSWLGQGTQSGRCWRPWWSSSSPPWCSPPPASPPPSDGWKWEERWIYERLPAFAWKHCSTHKGSAWEEWLVGYGQVWTWDWLR